MLTLTTNMAVLIGIVMALWLGAATWAIITGLQLRRRAAFATSQADRLAALLDTTPALPVVVRADGRIEAPERLGQWLGLPRTPGFVIDFHTPAAGLTESDANELSRDVAAAQRTGARFVRAVRASGSGRTLLMRGGPAPAALGASGSVIFWVFDATESQTEIGELADEVARLERAFAALSQLIEAAPVPMWHRGPDLRLTLVNRAYVEAVDAASAEDAVARGLELVEAVGGLTPIAAADAARVAGAATSRDVPATIGGKRRSMRVVDVPLGASGVAGYALDNDELDRSRAELRRFAEAQRDTLDRLSAGVAQFAADRSLTFSNTPFQSIFAMKPEWLSDRPEFDRVLDRMREAGRAPEARDFPAWRAERAAWFTTDAGAEESWLLPDGTHLRVVAQPVPDGGLIVVFEDRTEQLQLASARDTLLRVRTATFDNLFEAVGVFGADGRLTSWNNRFRDVWGFDEAMLSAHPRVDALVEAAAGTLTTPSRAALIRDLVRAATIERKSQGGRVAMKDGRHFEFAAVPLPDGNALFTMLDVTDSRRVERVLRDRAEAYEAADKVKTAFVANMSYELRTPLTSIGGFAEMLDKGYAGDLTAEAKQYVEAILESVGKLGSLVDDTLQLTQSDAGLAAVDRETVDLLQMLDRAVAASEDVALAKGIDFATDLHVSVGRVEGDARRLCEAVEKLLLHAVDATPPKGRVLLHASGTTEGALIVVSDNGPGTDDGDTPALAAPRDTIKAHGGALSVMAEAGQGTLVRIDLPR
ncbi:PAS domain-containing sensor histidine kinase [Sphingomonas sp. SUN039]|uniref:PAS domain-containing sensor histidine kinase n=1 Tax=Sphingomonas sp. SUN039 TaxID=2937787 RepID=UPI0021649C08|nr:PAS domain-containing sensor histidine kinase [Sphingomonas sp. SUN039]UVO53554.1 PAS-domain containing protein [Sphingomonas sp. SUN039]